MAMGPGYRPPQPSQSGNPRADGQWNHQAANQTNPNGPSGYGGDGSATWNDYNPKNHPLPTSTFPKLDVTGSPGSVSYNPDMLTQVAKNMQDELDALNGPNGARAKLMGIGSVNIFPPGQQVAPLLPTAAAFSTNANNATAGVLKFYDDLSKAYDTVIRNIHTTVSNYTNADQATQQAANNTAA